MELEVGPRSGPYLLVYIIKENMSKVEIEEKLISTGVWKYINMSGFNIQEDQEDLILEIICACNDYPEECLGLSISSSPCPGQSPIPSSDLRRQDLPSFCPNMVAFHPTLGVFSALCGLSYRAV